MKGKPTLLLVIALLAKFGLPAAAQEPQTAVPGLPPQVAPTPAPKVADESGLAEAPPLTNLQALWAVYSWSRGGEVEYQSRPGVIARALALPAMEPLQKCNVAVCSLPSGEDIRPDVNNAIRPTSYSAVNAGGVFESCPCQPGTEHALGLPPAWVEGTSIDGVSPLLCSINWFETASPAIQFNAGAGVCFFSEVCATSLGHQSCFSQTMGVGASMWVGCTLPSGMRIEAFVSGCAAQRYFESSK